MQLQGYTSKEGVVSAAKKAADMLDISLANFIGQSVEEKLEAMGFLGDGENPNISEIYAELRKKGVSAKSIVDALASLLEKEVCDA